MTDHSDYQKPRTNIYQLLAETYQSGLNESLFETTFNRFLSKSELQRVIGYIGQGNPNVLVNRQIQESTPHRQAYQLQPILYNKIGSVEHMSSWKDIQAELERLGVDLSRMQEWGSAPAFNWAPPIDYDKLLNYRDYYWYNPDDIADPPQYVTIQDPCQRVEAKLDEYSRTLDEFGATHDILALDSSNNTFTIEGDLVAIFTEDFIFYVKNSTNTTINNQYFTTISSQLNQLGNTIVTVDVDSPTFNDSIVNGVVSLEELSSIFESERDCKCNGSLGWDGGQWDDNQIGEVIWNATLLTEISHASEGNWIAANGTPTPIESCSGSPSGCNSLWYDTTNDELKLYSNYGSPEDWLVVQENFSSIIEASTGGELWDLSASCNVVTNAWIEENKWLHKNQVPNFSIAKQAKIPIIEFIPTLGLNEWSETTYIWQYRANPLIDDFTSTSSSPHLFELNGIDSYEVINVNSPEDTAFIFDGKYGDMTSIFVPGYQFKLTDSTVLINNITYTVSNSFYCEEVSGERYQTRVVVEEDFTITSPGTFDGILLPLQTSLGDDFEGLHEHWLFDGIDESKPVTSQPENIMLEIPVNPPPTSHDFEGSGSPSTQVYGSYVLSLYAQEITLTSDSFGEINIVSPDTGSPNGWILSGDHRTPFQDTKFEIVEKKLIVQGNTGGGVNGEYTISGVDNTLVGGNTLVYVEETVPVSATSTGTAYVEWVLPFDESLHNLTRVDTNELRIYVDDVRQFGTYEEIDSGESTVVSSPYVGSPLPTCDDFVNSVVMKAPVDKFGKIRIEVGAAATTDIGYENVFVRTDPNDMTFNPDLHLECVSLVRYRKLEQVKTVTNQYPLFDLFDVEGDNVNIASRIFTFQESQSEPVDQYFGRRIVHSADRLIYYYEQFLIDEDNGSLYAYRETSTVTVFWYDNDNEILYHWTGSEWETKILTSLYANSDSSTTYYITPIVSDEEPGEPFISIDGMVWFNTNNNSIYISTGIEGSPQRIWQENSTLTASLTVSPADPTVVSIWRTGIDTSLPCDEREVYVPEYVDRNRNPITIGDPDGDWEIPNQLYYNYRHENRKILSSTDLLAHFTDIINNQEVPVGLYGTSQEMFHAITDIDFGKGGVIKEYNYSYDSFLSSIFVQNVNPLQLYEFAHDAYENALNQIKELFRTNLQSLMTDISESAIADLSGDLSTDLIEAYEQNDFSNIVFGDSNTYDQTIGLGVRNWPATLPFIKMAFKVEPQILRDEELGLNELRHHDGHLSHVAFATTSINAFNQRIIRTEDTRSTNPTDMWGLQSSSGPPSTFSSYQSIFGNTAGCYWYHVTSTERILYRMSAVRVSGSEPVTTLPVGSFWYDTSANMLKILSEGSPAVSQWTDATTSVGLLTEDSTSAWEVINLDYLLSDVLLELETRLYQAAPDLTELAYDIDSIISENQSLADDLFETAFFEFISQTNIEFPFINSEFDSSDPFTWNYVSSNIGSPIFTDVTYASGGTWQDVYEKRYGTPYPHLEPWILQGYDSKPDWWDSEYADTTGTRRWTLQMWRNILDGIVPAGEILPNGNVSSGSSEVQEYDFVSVNIDSMEHSGYEPDDLFPPYWPPPIYFGSGSPLIPNAIFTDDEVRSIFTDDDSQIISETSDYQYGDSGLVEWNWIASSQYLYDRLKVAFKLDPVRFIHNTLGEEFLEVGCLQVSKRFEKVYAHQDAQFHGALLDDNTVLILLGTLQWYVNYNRFNGYDAASSNFRSMWTGWTAPLSYQFSSFIDTEALLVSNRNFDVTDQDYRVRIKRSPGIEDHWIDSLNVRLIKAPPSLIRSDTESQWVFDLNSFSTIGRPLTYYGSNSFPFSVNVGSPGGVTNVMTINDPHGRAIPWEDGDEVIVSSNQFLPSPLVADTTYYVYKISNFEFSLSESKNGPVIEILSEGVGNHTVSQIDRSFQALNGESTDKIWYRYTLDKSLVLTVNLPVRITGMQNITSIMYGYEAYEYDAEHFRFNHESTDIDDDTGRVINWQLEIERFINFAYNARTNIQRRHDSYIFTAEESPLIFKFETVSTINAQGITVEKLNAPDWRTGEKVTVTPGTGSVLPDPLLSNTHYYIIRDSNSDFRLALTSKNARNGIGISITSTGSGELYIQDVLDITSTPTHEVNPFRNNIWISTPQGVVADMFKGPFFDVRTDQLLFDQNGNRLPENTILPLRQDTLTRIITQDGIPNNVTLDFSSTPDPYNYLHMSSVHIFIDGYEHVILFNDYASDGSLIYDSFIGLNTPRFDVQFDRSPDFTLRPNLGGYVLLNQQDVDLTSKLVRNIEGQVEDLRYAYDTYSVVESNDTVEAGRDSIGYDGPFDFLDNININPKSQFLFWKGMIQAKGSVTSINAFINSRRFVDAKIDEFWAYKIADFGSSKELTLPEINIFISDTRAGEIRFHFVDATGTADKGFIEVTNTDQERWYEYPNQQEFFDLNGNMYFNVKLTDFIPDTANYIGSGSPITSYVLELPQVADEVVVVNTSTSTTLIEGVDYNVLNSKALQFLSGSVPTDITVYMITPYESKHNPCKIRDVIEEVTVAEAILWHPALNHHYHNAINLVDVQRDTDPVTNTVISGSPESYVNRYEYQVNTTTGNVEEVFADNYDPWGRKEVGTTWLDTNELGFVPYSDKIINPSIIDRLKYWGRLSDWASYRMYQWTESDVPPDEYDALAEEQEGDFSIDENVRVTGRVRKEIWKSQQVGSPEVTVWIPYNFEKYQVNSKLVFGTIPFTISSNEPATLYKNGEIYTEGSPSMSGIYESSSAITSAISAFTDNDFITVVKFVPEEDDIDDTTYKEVTQYSTEEVLVNGTPTTKYYFWVENKSVVESNRNKDISMQQAVQELETIPVPYVIPQKLVGAESESYSIYPFGSPLPYGSPAGSPLPGFTPSGSPIGTELITKETLPRRYTQAILRNYGTLINADDRYVLRFTRNFVLRDDLFDTPSENSLILKNLHQEWKMFRKEQTFNVDRYLWNLMVESVIGQTIASLGGTLVRVPSLDKELYDIENNDNTRIGIAYDGQAFCDGELAWAAILEYLQDGDNDFTPIDIQTFFETYDILNLNPRDPDDAQTISDALAEIYNTFTFTNVNRIFFSVFLTAAIPYNRKFQNIFKTSWVALHGIKILETNGIFDD